MRLFSQYLDAQPFDRAQGSAVTIGNFDGVHLGHQAMLNQLRLYAKQAQLQTVVVLFEPQPLEFFAKLDAPPRIMPLRQKIQMLFKCGVEHVLCLSFKQQIAQLSAESFIEQLLLQKLNAKYVLVGKDFHFGYKRKGNIDLLKHFAAQHKFLLKTVDTVEIEEQKISSTHIRKLLSNGQLSAAKQYLGHPFTMSGKVIHGQKQGRTIQVPTANLPVRHLPLVLQGVFIVQAKLQDHFKWHNGVASLGFRPTVDSSKKPLLEVHLFDFNENLYGKRLEVCFIHKIRDEQQYDSFETLTKYIYQDIAVAKRYFETMTIDMRYDDECL